MSSKKQNQYLIFLVPFILAWFFLSFKIHLYNKFTIDSTTAQSGVADLRDTVWSEQRRYFLSSGWAFYQKQSLTPDDLASKEMEPTTYFTLSKHGLQHTSGCRSGTYQITILLSPESRRYAFGIPRISGDYQIWINGQCYVDTILSHRVNSSLAALFFEASGQADIVIIANDMSQRQSGLIYPPAFGLPAALWNFMAVKLFVGGAACVLALALTLVFLVVTINGHKRREGLYRMLFCFCYAGSVSRLPIHMMSLRCIFFRVFIPICFFGMLFAFFMVFGTVCQMPRKWHYTICGLTLLQCTIVALTSLFPFLPYVEAPQHKFIIATFIALVGSAWWSLRHRQIHDRFLFAGTGVIAAALLNVVLYPQFESIYLPLESGMFLMLTLICASNTRYLIGLYIDKLRFQEGEQAARRLAGAERQKYKALSVHMDNLRHCKHEMRSQLITLLNLCRKGASDDLEEQLLEYLGRTEYCAYCGHNLLNALLSCAFTDDVLSRIVFKTEILGLPEKLPLEDIDLCSLVSNILQNAIEGCDRLPEGADKTVSCLIQARYGHLYICCVNSCPDDIIERDGQIVSSKSEPQLHGYGLQYVEMCVAKYDGLLQVSHGGGSFTIDIAIPIE